MGRIHNYDPGATRCVEVLTPRHHPTAPPKEASLRLDRLTPQLQVASRLRQQALLPQAINSFWGDPEFDVLSGYGRQVEISRYLTLPFT
jgi:hypothetical protein